MLWLTQSLRPNLREEVAVAYGIWMAILALGFVMRAKPFLAPPDFWEIISVRKSLTTRAHALAARLPR